eukprot:1191905-Prorocentrum_minimum.AAC.2
MKEHLLGVFLDPDNMHDLEVGGGNHSMYFNLTAIFPGRVVSAASHSNPALVTAASISQTLMTLTLVFSSGECHTCKPHFGVLVWRMSYLQASPWYSRLANVILASLTLVFSSGECHTCKPHLGVLVWRMSYLQASPLT